MDNDIHICILLDIYHNFQITEPDQAGKSAAKPKAIPEESSLLPPPVVEGRQQHALAESGALSGGGILGILKYGAPCAGIPVLLEYENHVLEYDPARRVPKVR